MKITLGENNLQKKLKSPYLHELNEYLKNLKNMDDFLKFPLKEELLKETDKYGNNFLHYIGLFLEEVTQMISRQAKFYYFSSININQSIARKPVIFDPSMPIQPHTLIVGQSGSGKSYICMKNFEFTLIFKNESTLYESFKDKSIENYVMNLMNYIKKNNLHDFCEKKNVFDEKPYQVYQNNFIKLWESMIIIDYFNNQLPINEIENVSKHKI